MIDLVALSHAVAKHGRLARVVIAGHKGSTPRETGTSMLVWDGGQSGTIGGGRLELDAAKRAVALLNSGSMTELRRHALGPALGQCCGGAVTLVTELWDVDRLQEIPQDGVYARRVERDADRPERLRRGQTYLTQGWLIEPVQMERQPVFIYGAGHVGATLAGVLAPMPQFEVHVVDARLEFLGNLPGRLQCHAGSPALALAQASQNAAHFIVTHDHDLDLHLCHRLLGQPFAYAGLIGSETKWARFRKRLAALGHSATAIDQIECPIGDPSLGKHPQAIAIGVAAQLLGATPALAAKGEVA